MQEELTEYLEFVGEAEHQRVTNMVIGAIRNGVSREKVCRVLKLAIELKQRPDELDLFPTKVRLATVGLGHIGMIMPRCLKMIRAGEVHENIDEVV